jgi:hypothetical protein
MRELGQLAEGFPVFLQSLRGEVSAQRFSTVPVMPTASVSDLFHVCPWHLADVNDTFHDVGEVPKPTKAHRSNSHKNC